jgi:hypothetical protein
MFFFSTDNTRTESRLIFGYTPQINKVGISLFKLAVLLITLITIWSKIFLSVSRSSFIRIL